MEVVTKEVMEERKVMANETATAVAIIPRT